MHADERRSFQGKEQVQQEIMDLLSDGSKLFPREVAARLNLTCDRAAKELGNLFRRGIIWRDGAEGYRKYFRTFQGELF